MEIEHNQLSKNMTLESSAITQHDGYVNSAFEDNHQKEDKVNDKYNVRINYKY